MHLHTQNLPRDPGLEEMLIPNGWNRGKETCLETSLPEVLTHEQVEAVAAWGKYRLQEIPLQILRTTLRQTQSEIL